MQTTAANNTAGTVLCVERNEAKSHGEDCTEARTQRPVPVVLGWFFAQTVPLCSHSRDTNRVRDDLLPSSHKTLVILP